MPFDTSGLTKVSPRGCVAHLQVAAIPIRKLNAQAQVLLVTTRGRGAWIVPKGWPAADHSAGESAQREAYEEAGVAGRIEPHSLGAFMYWKRAGKKRTYFQVHAFVLRAETLLVDWPERGTRKRCWFTPKNAAKLVSNPELGDLILKAAGRVRGPNS
jgi:8-oxo-dGTP pyrophosphatase MutT (NUDIX family)